MVSHYTNESRVSVYPFVRRVEGGEVIIGCPDTATFLALPPDAVAVLDALASGRTVGEATALYREKFQEELDVQALLERLEHEGFVWLEGREPEGKQGPSPLRFHFSNIPVSFARRFFSPPMLMLCGAIIVVGVVLLFTQKQLLPGWRAYLFRDRITLTYLLLMLLGYAAVFVHEMAHLLAARALGISCRLGIGNRLWMVVAETDMTGIWAVEPHKRYLPFLAGPLVDAVSASLLLIISAVAQKGLFTLPPLFAALLQALLLSYLMNLLWQCYFFVRTDFYYALANLFRCKNLLGDTVTYLRNQLVRMSGRGQLEDQSHIPAHEMRVIRLYAFIWVGGRAISFFALFKVTLPLIWGYLELLIYPSTQTVVRTRADVLGMFLIFIGPQILGLWLWLRNFHKPRAT